MDVLFSALLVHVNNVDGSGWRAHTSTIVRSPILDGRNTVSRISSTIRCEREEGGLVQQRLSISITQTSNAYMCVCLSMPDIFVSEGLHSPHLPDRRMWLRVDSYLSPHIHHRCEKGPGKISTPMFSTHTHRPFPLLAHVHTHTHTFTLCFVIFLPNEHDDVDDDDDDVHSATRRTGAGWMRVNLIMMKKNIEFNQTN